MARLNVLPTGYEITDYLFERTSSAALALDHDTIRGTADLEIWTGAGGTGTQLALTTDYTVSDEDTDLSTEAGVSIYTKLAIVNGTYHNVDLYATYKTIGDYNSTTSVRLAQIGLKEITGNYTVTADDHTIIVNTASAVTITIPDGLPQGFDICISRTLASTYAVTVAMSGSETIEGAASFITHGAFAESTLNDAEVVLRKKTATSWKFAVPPTVRAEYKGISLTTILAITDFTLKVEDTHNAVTTGANWKFTAPMRGLYLLQRNAYTTGLLGNVILYKNGVAFRYIGVSTDVSSASMSTTTLRLEAEDYIDTRCDSTSSQPGDSNIWIQITRIGS